MRKIKQSELKGRITRAREDLLLSPLPGDSNPGRTKEDEKLKSKKGEEQEPKEIIGKFSGAKEVMDDVTAW